MAQSTDNLLTHGLRGTIGSQLVFRQRDGKTIVSKAPTPSGKPPTAAQQAHLSRFQQAVRYAKAVLADPVLKEVYTRPGKNAFNHAVSDFYHAPTIEHVDAGGYAGAAGSVIAIRATDDFGVTAVTVRIETADGSLLEEGAALAVPGNDTAYRYTTTGARALPPGAVLIVTASDRAGNHTRYQCPL